MLTANTCLCVHASMYWELTPRGSPSLADSSGCWNVVKVELRSASLEMLSLNLPSVLSLAIQKKSVSFMCLKKAFGNILVFSVIHSKKTSIIVERQTERLEMAPCLQAANKLK